MFIESEFCLQEIQVPVKADNECGGGNGYFCAGGPQGNKPMDSCTGDSGSGVECTGQKGKYLASLPHCHLS